MTRKQKYNRKYWRKNKKKLSAYRKSWRRKNRKFYLKGVKRYANQNPGYNCRVFVGVKEYQKAVKSYPKDNRCQICRRRPKRERLCLDHCHATHKFRGWICRHCNSGIGQLRDSIKLLKRVISYLRRLA